MLEINKYFDDDFKRKCVMDIRKIFNNLNRTSNLEFLNDLDSEQLSKFVTVSSIKGLNGDIIGSVFTIKAPDFSDITIKVSKNYLKVSKEFITDLNFVMQKVYTVRELNNMVFNSRELKVGSDYVTFNFESNNGALRPVAIEPFETNIGCKTDLKITYEDWCRNIDYKTNISDDYYNYEDSDDDPMDFLDDFYNEHSNLVKLYRDKQLVRGKYLSVK